MPIHIAGGIPTEKLEEDLKSLLDTPTDRLDRIAAWLLDSGNPVPTGVADLSRMATAVEVDERSLREHLNLLRYILSTWRKQGFVLDNIREDLQQLAFDPDVIEKGLAFFAKVEPLKEQFFAIMLRGVAEFTGLPTIDDISLTWDLRPLFASQAYSPGDIDDESLIEWVSHTNLLIMEISASTKSGKNQGLTIQLTESEFDDLEKSLARARKQLDFLKSKRFI